MLKNLTKRKNIHIFAKNRTVSDFFNLGDMAKYNIVKKRIRMLPTVLWSALN